MIEQIIEGSIRNRPVVVLLALLGIVWGVHAMMNTPVDAIPDLSENQVIVFADWPGRSPQEIEDQVTYPLSVNLQALAGVKAVRASSEFNFSMISIIFEDGVDFYFARQRVLERLGLASTLLPAGVVPYLAPDATALGQIFWYTVEGALDPGRLRAIQDWYIRYQLSSVPGVAQVASVGGYPIEYQIDVRPEKLRALGVTLREVVDAVSRSNSAVGGRVVHQGNAEYLVRGVAWIRTRHDLEDVVVKTGSRGGTPVYLSSVATVQLGPQFRRSVLEKNGSEVTGGVVLMRHGENPLAVTRRIQKKLEELQPGLPQGVRIVPFYDRTRLIQGAIGTLTRTLLDEMLIASLAILLILGHLRSAFLICLTLPLAVLVSFILMRQLGIASNIMSLSGIAISIGVLVDQAVVMVENATHRLTEHFQGRRVEGDISEFVIPACTSVGRPIFFSVMIMLVSFLPVFSLGGQEGKTFHPLAYTKSFAMVGVAILSITLVPALIPILIRGRLRREEESWIVRSIAGIYRPVLTWALPRRNLVVWSFAVLLVLGAGLFPLETLAGTTFKGAYLGVLGMVTVVTVSLVQGTRSQLATFATLLLLGACAYHFPKLGKEYMPALDEGSILEMPTTVPRASVVEVTDDLKVRDGVLRRFPEVELVVGKAGRADTPTDPAPLDMVETIVNLLPQALWPRRRVSPEDATRQVGLVLAAARGEGLMEREGPEGKDGLFEAVSARARERFDRATRELIDSRRPGWESALGHHLARALVGDVVERLGAQGHLLRRPAGGELDRIAADLERGSGTILAEGPSQWDVTSIVDAVIGTLAAAGVVRPGRDLLSSHESFLGEIAATACDLFDLERPTLATRVLGSTLAERSRLHAAHIASLDAELRRCAPDLFTWSTLVELHEVARDRGLWRGPSGDGAGLPLARRLAALRGRLAPRMDGVLLWKTSKADLVKEMDAALKMPGWGNIWTQPIVNRIDMLATGVRTMIGVKVFGKDEASIQRVSEEVARVLKEIPGAADVFADQSLGKGYVEVKVDRRRAARYGLSVGDIQDTIDIALGGKTVTVTVEGRERHPVRVRYVRTARDDVVAIRNLPLGPVRGGTAEAAASPASPGRDEVAPGSPMQVPLSMVADVKVVDGPAVIKSENGLMRSYVQLNVRDRDVIGFIQEAQSAVSRRVVLPAGTYLQWSGQFENKIRSDRTLRVVFPLVALIVFLILYLTYGDLTDAILMMLAIPEAMVGGIVFVWLMGIHYSVAVQIGFIACFGMATETGIIMTLYLRQSIERRGGLEAISSLEELRQAVIEGAVQRLRPKLLTEGVAIVALAPMLWASGPGHEVMSAMVAPVLGGLLIADEVVDIFIPTRFYWVRRARWLALHPTGS